MTLKDRLQNLQNEYNRIRLQIIDNDAQSDNLSDLLQQLSGAIQLVNRLIEEENKTKEDTNADSKSS